MMRYNHTMLKNLNETELIWIDQPQQLRDIIDELAKQEILAVDTESNSLYAYQEQVCLIQFSTTEKDYLIDSLLLPDLSLLAPIFSSDQILKVFHAAEYDLICLFRDYGFRFNHLFDTMIAARTLGYPQIGLGALLEQFFGIQLDKKFQRANWGRRPLKAEILEYARLDSHFLIPLQAHLRKELKASARWDLALEDFHRLTQNIEDTTESSKDDFWKLRGARDLSPEKAAILKSLYNHREALAKAQNRPPFKVFSHQALVDIAQSPPRHRSDLTQLSSINERTANRYAKGLMQAVEQGRKDPPIFPPHTQRPANAVLDRMEKLRQWRKVTAAELGVPSDVVLPRDVLNRIAGSGPTNMPELAGLMHDVPYRFNRFGEQILNEIDKGDHHK